MLDKGFFLSLLLFAAPLVVLHKAFGYRLPYLAAIGLFIAIQLLVGRAWPARSAPSSTVGAGWPTSGPIGRFGQPGLKATFAASGLVGLLNPFQLVEALAQAAGNVAAEWRTRGREPPTHATRYTLPFDGEWLVYNGGTTPETSHSWDTVAQRYAYDFVVADQNQRRHRGRGTELADYLCHGQPILAAADGVVVAVEDRVGASPWVGYGLVDFTARTIRGNHIVIRHAEGEFGFYAHLAKGSIRVATGEHVTRSQVIGHCGHSGHSAEPHLHFHLQDRASFFLGAGLPLRFSSLTVNGVAQDNAQIGVGDRVAPCPGLGA